MPSTPLVASLADHLLFGNQAVAPIEIGHQQRPFAQKREAIDHAAQLRCQYPQKSTLGLFRIASATTRSAWKPFGSFR